MMKPLRALILVSMGLLGASPSAAPPNIVFILADDLGWGELGCYGQKKIRTPNIDRLAAEGRRFTQFYCGNAVCAPSRCVFMTGRHPGHAWVRDNRELKPEGQTPIPEATVTIAKLLKARGYATGATGKWGLGGPGSEGDPNKQGFDLFYGYNCQRHAHNYYPSYLWRNNKKVELEGNNEGITGKQYSHDLIEVEALDFIRAHKDQPFFLYVPFTIPHVALQVPEDSVEEYRDQWPDPPYLGGKGYLPHPHPRAAHAGMITRMDRSVGRLLNLIASLKLDENTIVMFSSDNGSIDAAGGHDLPFFEANGILSGQKGTLYEGGIRIPFIVRWPGKIKAGGVSAQIGGFVDLMPTFCEIGGATAPADADGISLLPELTGEGKLRERRFLYWEFPSGGGQQAVRMGDWKGIRTGLQKAVGPLQLFNLESDPSEKNDVAAAHPDEVRQIEKIMSENHTPSKLFPLKALDN